MLNEKKLTKAELDKREEIIMNMKKNKRSLVSKYGKDAEAVMYGRATNMAKKQSESMEDNRLSELIKDALTNPKAADLDKDGKLSSYEKTRGAAIEKNLSEYFGYEDEDMDNPDEDLVIIGSGYLDIKSKFGERPSQTNGEYAEIGQKVVDQLHKGDKEAAIDYIMSKINEVGGYDRKGNKITVPSDDDVKRRKVGIGNALEEEGKKLTKLKDIKETIKQMRSINEKSYPFDKCIDDNESKYGKKGAAKICGSIRAAFGENLDENHSDAENDKLKQIEKELKGASKMHKRQAKTIKKIVKEDDVLEGLPKGYFKKEFGIGKKKKIKEASGPATIEDTEKAARKVVQAIKLEQPEDDIKVSRGLEEGSFDIDINDRNYDGGSYTVDSDGDITLVSIRKPGFVGNLNDAASTIQSTMDDILTNSSSKSGPAYSPENNE